MKSSVIQSVLSSRKQRQRYYYFKNGSALICGVAAYMYVEGGLGVLVGIIAAVLAYITVAPVIAFLVCLFEQMAS